MLFIWLIVIMQCAWFTSPPTQYRLYGRRAFYLVHRMTLLLSAKYYYYSIIIITRACYSL